MDYQPAVAQCAGIGRYTRLLATEIGKILSPEDALRLFYFDFRRNADVGGVAKNTTLVPFRALPGAVVQRAWRHADFPPFDWFAGAADVFHFTNFMARPVRRGKSVVSIHDMSFERFPEFAEAKNLRYLRAGIRDTVRRADAIITISKFSATEIEEFFPEACGRVRTTYLGISDDFTRANDAEIADVKKRLGLSRPFMLTVGTIEPRKNLEFLVDVFERVAESGLDLVVAGAPGWKCEPIMARFENSRFRDRLHYVRFVPDGCLAALYSAAEVFVTPSHYEGFGFPPLEAMACGTPVISSAGGSLPEVLGDAARVVPGFDAEAWADAVQRVCGDTALRTAMTDAGVARSREFRWSRTAAETLAIYRDVAR